MFLILGDLNYANFGNQIADELAYQFVILSYDFIGSHWMPGPTVRLQVWSEDQSIPSRKPGCPVDSARPSSDGQLRLT